MHTVQMGASWEHRLTDVDTEARTAMCAACGPVEIARKHRGAGLSPGWMCRVAKRSRRGNTWVKKMAKKHGLSREDWDILLISQSGRCWICEDPMREPCLDHDHETGEVRGLLCSSCNAALGLFQDSVAILTRAIEYLRG